MTDCTRRKALGATLALGPAALCPTLAMTPSQTAAPPDTAREAQVRQVIETYTRAWKKGDIPALLNCYHADFTLNWFGRNALAGRHVGKEASVRALGGMRNRTDRRLTAIVSVMASAERGAMLTRETLTAKGRSVEAERLYLFTVAGDKLLECWVYDQDQRLVDELIGA